MEQTTEPEKETNNENLQETHDDEVENPQKDRNITPEIDAQNTPEIPENIPSQEEPINTRGEKYNLRPNPNPNYSDSYRY